MTEACTYLNERSRSCRKCATSAAAISTRSRCVVALHSAMIDERRASARVVASLDGLQHWHYCKTSLAKRYSISQRKRWGIEDTLMHPLDWVSHLRMIWLIQKARGFEAGCAP